MAHIIEIQALTCAATDMDTPNGVQVLETWEALHGSLPETLTIEGDTEDRTLYYKYDQFPMRLPGMYACGINIAPAYWPDEDEVAPLDATVIAFIRYVATRIVEWSQAEIEDMQGINVGFLLREADEMRATGNMAPMLA